MTRCQNCWNLQQFCACPPLGPPEPPAPVVEPETIVRLLAEAGPYSDSEWGGCMDCDAGDIAGAPSNPAEHEPTCLWAMARRWADANPVTTS